MLWLSHWTPFNGLPLVTGYESLLEQVRKLSVSRTTVPTPTCRVRNTRQTQPPSSESTVYCTVLSYCLYDLISNCSMSCCNSISPIKCEKSCQGVQQNAVPYLKRQTSEGHHQTSTWNNVYNQLFSSIFFQLQLFDVTVIWGSAQKYDTFIFVQINRISAQVD